MEKLGHIPKGVSSVVKKKLELLKRIHQIEAQVKHDVIAFLATSVTEKAGIKSQDILHQGMTSSDRFGYMLLIFS